MAKDQLDRVLQPNVSDDSKDGMSSNIPVVVTGGCGCLGQELIQQLLAKGTYTVHCLDLFIPPISKRISGVASYIQADIANYSDVSRALHGMEVVFHTAGLIPVNVFTTSEALERVNAVGTRNVVKACKEGGVKRLIYTSSYSVILSKDKTKNRCNVDELLPLPKDPIHPYVRTKGIGEMSVREAHGKELKTCSLRLGTLIGGNNDAIKSMMSDAPVVLGDGSPIMPITTVSSAAHVHILAERYLQEGRVSSNVFNVISANAKSFDVAHSFAKQNGSKPPRFIPMWLCKGMGIVNEGIFWLTGLTLHPKMCYHYLVFFTTFAGSTKRAEEDLGWVERKTVDEIVAECIKKYYTQKK